MKTKHFLLTVFFATLSTALFAQVKQTQIQPDKIPSYQLHQRQGNNHEFDHPPIDDLFNEYDFYGLGVHQNFFMPENDPWKNVQNTDDPVYYCDSAFTYSTNNVQNKTIYTRDANGRVLVLLRQIWNTGNVVWLNITQELYAYYASGNMLWHITQDWNIEMNAWVNNSKVSYTYDDSLRPIDRLQQIWDIETNAWINQSKISLSFNSSGNILSYLEQIWNIEIGDWENQTKYSFSYDTSENTLSQLIQQWDTETGSWENEMLNSYSYDASGNLLTQLRQWWNTDEGLWINNDRFTRTYDLLGYIETVLYQFWENGDWDIVYYEIYTNTASGKPLTCIDQKWDSTIGDYVNNWKLKYTYDGSENELSRLYQDWNSNSGEWKNVHKESHTYDASGNMLSELSQSWSSSLGDWKNNYRYSYTYDTSGNQLSKLSQDWDIDLDEWINLWKKDYEYDYGLQKVTGMYYLCSGVWVADDDNVTLYLFNRQLFSSTDCFKAVAWYSDYITAINDEAKPETMNTSFCSPNPAKDQIVVSNPFNKDASLKIFNLNGKLVKEKQLGKGQNQIPVQNLPAGIYLFAIQSGNEIMKNKVAVY